jgi:hypothetical protein
MGNGEEAGYYPLAGKAGVIPVSSASSGYFRVSNFSDNDCSHERLAKMPYRYTALRLPPWIVPADFDDSVISSWC